MKVGSDHREGGEEMAESKYGKYILRETGVKPHPEITAVTPALLEGLKDWGGIQHRMSWKYVSQPVILEREPHSHDFDEFLCFLGCDPLNALDFGAEAELALGREGEKHIVDASSVIFIPKGLIHCPLSFRKIGKPILFCNIYLAPKYARKLM
jgi:hypothetical protein